MIIGVMLVVFSGCYPVFVPEDRDHRERGHDGQDRGGHRDHDHEGYRDHY